MSDQQADRAIGRMWELLAPVAQADAARMAGSWGEDAAGDGLLWLVGFLGQVRRGEKRICAAAPVGYLLSAVRREGLIVAEERGLMHGGMPGVAAEIRRGRKARKLVSEALRDGLALDAEALTDKHNTALRARAKDPEKSGSLLSVAEVRDAIRAVAL